MTTDPEDQYQEVKKKAARGMGWNYLSFGLGKVLSLITIAILAHLLPPESFGLVALATLTIDYLSIFNDLGLGAALIQRKHSIEESANTAFALNLLAGILLTFVTFLLAPFAADFFREGQVTVVLRWLGLTFVLNSFGSVHNVILKRELNFKKKIIPELGNTITKAIVSISLALSGFGVWALVVGQLAGTGVASALLWIVLPWRPRLAWDKVIAKELFQYGVSIMGNNALSIWEDSFDYLIIGRLYNSALLGIYTLAYRLPQILVINILWVMTAVLFPVYSSLQDDTDSLKRSFLSIVRYVELLVTPICIGMFVVADPIIRVAFGEQWVDSIPLLRVLSLYALVISIGFHIGDIYKAIGRPDILIKISIPVFFIRILALWVGAQYSILGVGIGHLAAALIAVTIRLVVASRILNIKFIEIIKELKAFIGGAVLNAFTMPALYLTQTYPPLTRLIVVVAGGAIGYIGSIWFIERNSVMKAMQMIGIKGMGKWAA